MLGDSAFFIEYTETTSNLQNATQDSLVSLVGLGSTVGKSASGRLENNPRMESISYC